MRILENIRNIVVNLLTKRYATLKSPDSLKSLANQTCQICIVSQSESVIVEAILKALAQRFKYKDLQNLYKKQQLVESTESPNLLWCSIHQIEALENFLRSNNQLKLITFSIFLARGPVRTNPSQRLGLIKGLVALWRPCSLIFSLSEPISIQIQTKTKIERILKLEFYRSLKLLRGTLFQPVQEQAKVVLGGAEYEREIRVLANRAKRSVPALKKQAKAEFLKMAASPNFSIYYVLAKVARIITKKLFSEIIVNGLDSFERTVRQHTVVLVPMHRSHLDYILVSYVLYKSQMNPPLVAAGVNLNFWPVGYFIRGVGAYFVKRGARQDRLHAMLLRRYVSYLIKRGHLQEFFIEGARSRSGRMLPPKVGLLGIMADAIERGAQKDLLFIPVSISYEQVIEDAVYARENTGQAKVKENFFSFLKASTIFKKSYGEVVVQFGSPISLEKFRTQQLTRAGQEDRSPTLELAYELTRQIQDNCCLTLTSLAYAALLTANKYTLSRDCLIDRIKQLALTAQSCAELHGGSVNLTPSLKHFLEYTHGKLESITESGAIQRRRCLGADLFVLPGKTRFTADFYKNATLHFFFEPAFCGLLQLLNLDIENPVTQQLQHIFSSDFILPDWSEHIHKVKRCQQILSTSKTKPFPELLLSALQSLLWVHLNLELAFKDKEIVDYKDISNSLIGDFKTAMYTGIMVRTEAASHAAIISTLDGLVSRGLISIVDANNKPAEIRRLKPLTLELEIVKKANKALIDYIDNGESILPRQEIL